MFHGPFEQEVNLGEYFVVHDMCHESTYDQLYIHYQDFNKNIYASPSVADRFFMCCACSFSKR